MGKKDDDSKEKLKGISFENYQEFIEKNEKDFSKKSFENKAIINFNKQFALKKNANKAI